MENKKIADIFDSVADILELTGKNRFRIRAYRNAARSIRGLTRRLEEMAEEDVSIAKTVKGIGKDLEGKILEMIRTGSLSQYEELLEEVPPDLPELLELEGLGAKKVKKLHDELGISNMKDLEEACEKGVVQEVEGFGKTTQRKLLDSLSYFRQKKGRMTLQQADIKAREILEHLEDSSLFERLELSGSLRRGKETVGDIDILAVVTDNDQARERFLSCPGISEVISSGDLKCSVKLTDGPQVDLRMVERSSFGAAWIYFTGSKEHNVKLRKMAKSRGLKLNEYGLFSGSESLAAGKTEKDLYEEFDMEWIPPELREDSGEVEAASEKSLPEGILAHDQLRGELHVHTRATDGHASAEHMIEAAKERGLEYIAVTDHTKAVRVAGGLDDDQMNNHAGYLRELDGKFKEVRVLTGAEVDILKNGELDLSEETLKGLDVVIAAVHSNFKLSKSQQTERVIKAIKNPNVNILAHPTCRLIGHRRALDLDMEAVFKEASKAGVYLEINSQADRMDLKDIHCRRAQELGAKFVISSDAHRTEQLQNARYGILVARRGWVLKKNILNTYGIRDLKKALRKEIY